MAEPGVKKPVVMEEDLGKPNGPATLDADGKLAESQRPSLKDIGAVAAFLGVIEGDISVLDDAKTPGHLSFLDTYGALGHTGALYDVEVSKTNYDGADAITQTATRTYPNNLDAKFERTYYVVGGWSAWKQLATTDYAVAKDGSTPMTGPLMFNIGDAIAGVIPESGNKRLVIRARTTGSNNRREIFLATKEFADGLKDALQFYNYADGAGTIYPILHTGNKPSGSYTGNGDATARTIETGGIGNVVAIWSGYGVAFASYGGVLYWDNQSTSVYGGGADTVMFYNGTLRLTTNVSPLNANGVTYYYQVL